MRRGFPSLALQVQEVLRKDPLSGHLSSSAVAALATPSAADRRPEFEAEL
ncbi:hypothetical protein [Bradyrhizobium sp. DASA03120]